MATKKPANPEAWVAQIFFDKDGNSRQQVTKGGVLRRSKSSVKEQGAEAALKKAVKKLGFFLFENDNEFIVLCGNNLKLLKL
ncbi:MAG: hypothetical protein K8J09_05335 [Planctomycetes bacterium]|nr:hypothetical protein [Planctomycetota bacterium]